MFSLIFAGTALAILLASLILQQLDFAYTDNDLIRQYQLRKLASDSSYETIIVGDSSAGNAIDAQVFSQLSGRPTINLALTGSFGIEGSLNMIRHASAKRRPRNVVIIQTLDIWNRPFSLQAYFESEQGLPPIHIDHPFLHDKTFANYVQYVVNPREIGWFLSYVWGSRNFNFSISKEIDYFSQRRLTFANGGLQPDSRFVLPTKIHEEKKVVFEILDLYCGREQLNCIYMHGPLLDDMMKGSGTTVAAINDFLTRTALHIKIVQNTFGFEANMMGDSVDHVANSQKSSVTRQYFQRIKSLLQ